jgi:chromosome condensin MukBEF MukE localization factor
MIWVLMIPWLLAAIAIPVIPALRSTLREDRRVRMNATVANGVQAQLRPARVRSHS